MPRLVEYIRVSRTMGREGESFQSPDQQRKANRAIVHLTPGAEIVETIEELDESGGTMSRPGIQRAISIVESGEADGIVVAWLDRWARTLEALTLIEDWAVRGKYFISAAERFDATTSHGKFALGMMLLVAKYYRDRTIEQWSATLDDAVMKRGIHPAGYGAYGYDRIGKRFVPNDAALFVLEAFERRVRRESFGAIASWLNTSAPPHPRLDKRSGDMVDRPWTGPAVQRMLGRRVYLGEASYGAYINPDAHPAIVPEALWLAAQERVHAHSKKRSGEVALLQGLVRCAGCRYLMSPGVAGGGSKRQGQYRCRKKHVSGTCPAPASVRADRLETYVEAAVAGLLDERLKLVESAPDSTDLAEAQNRLERARAVLEEMRQDVGARERLGARWLSWLEPYLAEEEEAATHLAEIAARTHGISIEITGQAYLGLPRDDRRAVLPALLGAVMVRNVGGPRGPQARPLSTDRVRLLLPESVPDFPKKSHLSRGVVSWSWPEDEAPAGVLPC